MTDTVAIPSTTTELRERLLAIRNLLSDPEHWTNQSYATDSNGNVVDPESDDACRWDVIGASLNIGGGTGFMFLDAIVKNIPGLDDETVSRSGISPIVAWQGSATHETTLRVLDAAIVATERARRTERKAKP